MIRLDMSEFAKPDSYERLIGTHWQPGVLTDPVRSQPFSLVLLDEIEKSSLNVFDLCLQLFDAGRLTDGKGITADFRRTLIIVTTNVGAVVSRKGAVGFVESAAAAPDRGDAIHAERELSMVFRPEFLNRFDHIVRFRPLDEQVVARIAERELRKVLERSGIRRRGLTLDVDPSLLALLLREGYSPTFGARPLKRAVERKVLLPVAWALARGEASRGSTMRLSAVSGQVRVSIAPPEAQHAEQEAPAIDELQERGDLRHASALMLAEVDELVEAFAPMQSRLSARLIESSSPGFYSDPSRSRAVLDEIYRLDGARREVHEVQAAIAAFDERMHRGVRDERELAVLNRRARTLEGRLDHVRFIVSCDDLEALGDAYVTITRLRSKEPSLDGVFRLAGMYRAFAERRGLTCEVVDDRADEPSGEETVSLLVSGCGAYALLHGESGLHKFRDGGSPRDVRETVRVLVQGLPLAAPNPPADAVSIEVRKTARPGRLVRAVTLEVRLLHRASKTSLRADCDGSRDWALERLMPLLFVRVAESSTNEGREDQLVRRYSLGPNQRVRDIRTGYSTGRLDRVLRGDIERFLTGHRRR
ncbi:MAG: AAA family ATPase [Gemmatimonadetes bacterium]|nr:AAA family ATPase [Gemmatimonadota bacterium]